VSDGSYGVPAGLISSFHVASRGGALEIVPGLDIDDFSRQNIERSLAELVDERDTVRLLGLLGQ
jgi:malate dehydrogenase